MDWEFKVVLYPLDGGEDDFGEKVFGIEKWGDEEKTFDRMALA